MELLRDVFESLPDAVVVTDENGHIVLVNAQTATLFGYKRDELLGNMIEMLVPQRFRAKHIVHRAEMWKPFRLYSIRSINKSHRKEHGYLEE